MNASRGRLLSPPRRTRKGAVPPSAGEGGLPCPPDSAPIDKIVQARRRHGVAKRGRLVRNDGRLVAQIAQQAQDLEVEPDERDGQAERGVPGELLVGAVADALLDHLE